MRRPPGLRACSSLPEPQLLGSERETHFPLQAALALSCTRPCREAQVLLSRRMFQEDEAPEGEAACPGSVAGAVLERLRHPEAVSSTILLCSLLSL